MSMVESIDSRAIWLAAQLLAAIRKYAPETIFFVIKSLELENNLSF